MPTEPGYLAIDVGCGCHWRIYRVTRSGHMLGGYGEYTDRREAYRLTQRYNLEAGYCPSVWPGQYSGVQRVESTGPQGFRITPFGTNELAEIHAQTT